MKYFHSMSKIEKSKNMFFASCPGGLEEFLLEEVQTLKPKNATIVRGGVQFEALPEVAIELMFLTRIASRLYKTLYVFDIKSEKDLYYMAKDIKWKAIFDITQTFKINVIQSRSPDGKKRSKFENSMYLGQKLKDAIVDTFRSDFDGARPSVEKVHPDVTFLLHLEPHDNPYASKEKASILIDLSGRPLSQRGYKVAEFEAPLRENLAAGLVKMMNPKPGEDFIDGMCGSGTILIEAMLQAGDIPPCFLNLSWIGSDRRFWDMEHHFWFFKSDYLKEKFKEIVQTYEEKAKIGFEKLNNMKGEFRGNDINPDAVRAALENLKRAGLHTRVELSIEDALGLEPKSEKGIIVINPPYGERLGADDDLEHLYHEFGETLKHKFKGFRAFVLTGNLPLIKKISLKTSRREIVYNGNIESRFVEYQLY